MKPQFATECNSFTAARAYFEQTLQECERLAASGDSDLSAMEVTGRQRSQELGRLLMQGIADTLSFRFDSPELTGADGFVRSRRRVSERTILTTFGPVRFARIGFFAEGVTALFPLDAALNLPVDSHTSLELQRHVARECARGSFEQACDTLETFLGVSPGKRQAEETALCEFSRYLTVMQAQSLSARCAH